MLLASSIRLVLLIFVAFWLVLMFRRRENFIRFSERHIVVFSIYKFSPHKIILFLKSEPRIRFILNSLTLSFLPKPAFFGHFRHFQTEYELNQLQSTQKGICNKTVCLSFHQHCVFRHFCLGIRRNQNFEKVTYVFRLFVLNFNIFFSPLLFLLFLSLCCSD